MRSICWARRRAPRRGPAPPSPTSPASPRRPGPSSSTPATHTSPAGPWTGATAGPATDASAADPPQTPSAASKGFYRLLSACRLDRIVLEYAVVGAFETGVVEPGREAIALMTTSQCPHKCDIFKRIQCVEGKTFRNPRHPDFPDNPLDVCLAAVPRSELVCLGRAADAFCQLKGVCSLTAHPLLPSHRHGSLPVRAGGGAGLAAERG